MSEILDRVREQYPAYEGVSDDDLTLSLASKFPQYLDADKDFKSDFDRISQQRRGAAVDAAMGAFNQMHPDISQGPRLEQSDSLAPVLAPIPTPEPKLPIPELRQYEPPPRTEQAFLS